MGGAGVGCGGACDDGRIPPELQCDHGGKTHGAAQSVSLLRPVADEIARHMADEQNIRGVSVASAFIRMGRL
jgi:hypothetical protein